MRIAIVLHVYHVEVAEYILSRLEAINFRYHLFISIADVSVRSQVVDLALKFVKESDITVVMSPNIGRNFGPLLVEFSKSLQEFDLLCHIHTKKSEHRGETLSAWGKFLIDRTIGSHILITKIVNYFSKQSNCGLIYPEKFHCLPFWSQSWLGNYEIANRWCQSFGINIDCDYLHYPIGGMFWARIKSIEQLLAYHWTYKDFPPELGQLDGTMHHAVERLFGFISSYNKYDHYVVCDTNNELSIKSVNNFPTDPNLEVERLSAIVSKCDMISFDLFSLFGETSRSMLHKFVLQLSRSISQNSYVYDERTCVEYIESLIFKSTCSYCAAGNINFHDLVRALVCRFNASYDDLIVLEDDFTAWQLEPKLISVYLYEAILKLDKNVVLLAECCFSKDWVEKLLSSNKITHPDIIYTTSQGNGSKIANTVWKYLALEAGAEIECFAHFGCDIIYDYHIPLSNGMMAVCLPSREPYLQKW